MLFSLVLNQLWFAHNFLTWSWKLLVCMDRLIAMIALREVPIPSRSFAFSPTIFASLAGECFHLSPRDHPDAPLVFQL